jgi:hypothetical protein
MEFLFVPMTCNRCAHEMAKLGLNRTRINYMYALIPSQTHNKFEFCYSMYYQREIFIYLDVMVKNIKIYIHMYFKW